MTRDPSDGSVRTAVDEKPQSMSTMAAKVNADNGLMSSTASGPDTGLRQPTRTDAQIRLERSREWLKDYHAKHGAPHADGGNDGKEHSAGGDSSNDQGQDESGLPAR